MEKETYMSDEELKRRLDMTVNSIVNRHSYLYDESEMFFKIFSIFLKHNNMYDEESLDFSILDRMSYQSMFKKAQEIFDEVDIKVDVRELIEKGVVTLNYIDLNEEEREIKQREKMQNAYSSFHLKDRKFPIAEIFTTNSNTTNDLINFTHELMHYTNNDFETGDDILTRELFTEGFSIFMEFMAIYKLYEEGNVKDAKFLFRLRIEIMLKKSNELYPIMKYINLYKVFNDLSLEHYNKLYNENLTLEEHNKRINNIKFYLKNRSFSDLYSFSKYVFGTALAIEMLKKYLSNNTYKTQIAYANSMLNKADINDIFTILQIDIDKMVNDTDEVLSEMSIKKDKIK